MKLPINPLIFTAVALALALPSARMQSQAAPAVDSLSEIQALEKANDDFLKRQDDTLKDLTEMTTTAHEVRIFTKRG